jgi:hypothetical protein
VEPNILKVFPPEEPEDDKGLMSTEERMDTDISGAKTIIKSSTPTPEKVPRLRWGVGKSNKSCKRDARADTTIEMEIP